MDDTQGKGKVEKGGKENLPDCFKGKATILKLYLKLTLIDLVRLMKGWGGWN